MVDPFFLRFVSLGFTLLFLLASAHKLTGLEEFQAALSDYRLIPPGLVRLTAHLIPMVEVSLALGWLFAVQIQIVAYASAGLLAAYGLAMGINLLRGRVHIGCGCGFGGALQHDQQLSVGLVLRNVGLASIALVVTRPGPQRELGAGEFVMLLAAVVVSALLYASVSQLFQNNAAINSWRKALGAVHD